jgi:hypothetical protein
MMIVHNPLDTIKVTSQYGQRIHPVTGLNSFHTGIDLSAAIGTPCYAVADGTVKISKVNNGGASVGLGYYIVIEHDEFCTVYCHLNALGIDVGTHVKAGDVIALTGNTGASTGPHLHFEIRSGAYSSNFWAKDSSGAYANALNPSNYVPVENFKREDGEDMTQERFNEMYAVMIAEKQGDNPSEWAKDATAKAKRKGVFNGDGAGNYNWQSPVTREALAAVMDNAGILDTLPDKDDD